MTKTRFLTGLGLSLVISAAMVSAALAGPWVTTEWQNTELSQEACLEHAERAIRNAGFQPLQHTSNSWFGGRGDYTVSVRCITEKQLVFFLAAGPNGEQTGKYADAVANKF